MTIELVILLVLLMWLLGAFVVPVGGSFIHVLIVVVIVLAIVRLASGRRIL